jgi:hypothetical protein
MTAAEQVAAQGGARPGPAQRHPGRCHERGVLHGHIEDIPLPDNAVDMIISNCAINLSGNKPAVRA